MFSPFKAHFSSATFGLSRRLMMVFAGLVVVSVALMTLINLHTQRTILVERSQLNLEHAITLASEVSLPYVLANNPAGLEIFYQELANHDNLEIVELFDPNGWRLVSGDTQTATYLGLTDEPLVLRAIETGERQVQRTPTTFHAAHPVFVGDDLVAVLNIHLCGKAYIQSLQAVWINNLMLGSALIVIGLMLSGALARRLSRPLTNLTQATQQVADGDFNHRITLNSNDEFEHLAGAFNAMIGKLKDSMREIHRVAYEDKLTGAPNRSWLNTQLEQLTLRYAHAETGFAVMFLDLNKFKGVNDTYGHHVGDQLLRAFSKRLGRCLREESLKVRGVDFDEKQALSIEDGEALLARLGGDEFTLIVPLPNAEAVAQRISNAMEAPFRLEGCQLQTSTSVGIAIFPMHAVTREHLLKCADVAMYQAKGSTKATFAYYNHDTHSQLMERSALERDLEKAVEEEAFQMVLQPQRRVDTGDLVGAEALIRWNHAERGMVSPADFLPVAASNGLLPVIGRQMLGHAIAAAAKVNKGRADSLAIAVNIGIEELNEEGFADAVIGLLEKHGTDPSWLEIEITEGTAMEESGVVERQVMRLSEIGVRFAIDDFGMGYSNLGRLRALAFQTLKMDRSLMIGLGEDPASEHLVSTIMDMAQAIGADVVAEGIETEEQLEFLKTKGCGYYQGYFGGKPVPADDFVAWARAENRAENKNEKPAEQPELRLAS